MSLLILKQHYGTAWLLAPFTISLFWSHVGKICPRHPVPSFRDRRPKRRLRCHGGSGQLRMVIWVVQNLGPPGLDRRGNLICLWSVQHLWICRDMNFRSMPGLPELGLGLSQVITHCYRYDKKHTWSGTWSNVSSAGTKWAWRTHRIQYHYCSRTDSCSFFNRSVSGANHAQKRIPSPGEANFCKEITTSWCLNYHPKHLHHPIHIYIYIIYIYIIYIYK